MSVIKIENLVRDYGGGKGVFDISFHVNQGEAFGFLYPEWRRKNNNNTPFNGVHKTKIRKMHH